MPWLPHANVSIASTNPPTGAPQLGPNGASITGSAVTGSCGGCGTGEGGRNECGGGIGGEALDDAVLFAFTVMPMSSHVLYVVQPAQTVLGIRRQSRRQHRLVLTILADVIYRFDTMFPHHRALLQTIPFQRPLLIL